MNQANLFGIKAVVFDVFGTLVEIGDKRRSFAKLMKLIQDAGRPARPDDAQKIMSNNVGLVDAAKDSAYHQPDVNGVKNTLRHVHLVPLADAEQLADWNKKWTRRSRKTSDRALVYVSDGSDKFLLIFILDEPDAHAIAKMGTSEHRAIMEGFALTAEEFIHNGIIAV